MRGAAVVRAVVVRGEAVERGAAVLRGDDVVRGAAVARGEAVALRRMAVVLASVGKSPEASGSVESDREESPGRGAAVRADDARWVPERVPRCAAMRAVTRSDAAGMVSAAGFS